jgi:hypothetical protein
MDFSTNQPPATLSEPAKALWWLKKGGLKLGAEWEKAHEIYQMAEGTRAYDLVHALAHWIEGDTSNRDYWYRRISGWKRAETIAAEGERVWSEVG